MPTYSVACFHDQSPRDVFATMAEMRKGLTCEVCHAPLEQRFAPSALPGVRIECSGEPSNDPRRVADGSAQFNLGLRGVDTVVGTRADGTPKLEYRPLSVNEASSRKSIVERAKRQNLQPVESGGRYRTVVK